MKPENVPSGDEDTLRIELDQCTPSGASVTGFLSHAVHVYLPDYWGRYVLIVLAVILALTFEVSLNLSYGPLLDDAIPHRDARKLGLILGGLGILFVLSSLGDLLRDYSSARLGARLLNYLRLKLFNHMQALPAGFYAAVETGAIVSRFANDLEAIEAALTLTLPWVVQDILRFLAAAVVMFVLDWRLALILALAFPPTFLVPRALARRATRERYQCRRNEAAVLNWVQEYVGAQATIRAFGVQRTVLAAFGRQLEQFAPNIFSAGFYERLVTRTTDIGYWFVYLVVIGAGAYETFRGELAVGRYMSFVSILIVAGSSLTALSSFVAQLIPAAVGQQRIDELLHEQPGIPDSADAATLPPFSKEICFDQISFAYRSTKAGSSHLEKVSFSIPALQATALVGPSGAGKSTVLSLLMRFYDPDAGRILIDGHDLRHVSQASLRSQMGVVLQDTFLFNMSVRENIRLSKPEATDAEVEAAARASEIHEFITGLPQGYDTTVGERGGRLSAGQRQRISLARAILRNPAILLLDEATSALDAETEAAIDGTLRKLAQDRTVLSVSHHLVSVAGMDRIIVMDQGRIAEQGSHQELLDRRGLYWRLCRSQEGLGAGRTPGPVCPDPTGAETETTQREIQP